MQPNNLRLLYQFLSLLLFCGTRCSASSKFLNLNNGNDFYQDLTVPINKVLQEENISGYCSLIKDSLKKSSFVYYETDFLLAEIEQIIPVIDLLQSLKENDVQPQLILSLRYMNQTSGTFLWERLGDVYYDEGFCISRENQSKIVFNVAAITLNFYENVNSRSIYDEGPSYPKRFAFTNYVKRFITENFWKDAIQVGVSIGSRQANHYSYHSEFLAEYGDIDFVIYQMELDPVAHFPVSFQEFNNTLSKEVKKITEHFWSAFHKGTERNPNKISDHVKIMIKIAEVKPQTYTYTSSGNYWSASGSVLEKTSIYKNTSENVFLSAQQRSPTALQRVALRSLTSQGYQFIISKPMQNLSTDFLQVTERSARSNLTLPFVQVKNVQMDSLELRSNLSMWKVKYDSILVDEVTWMEMKRFRSDLENERNNSDTTANLQVMLWVNDDLREKWAAMEIYMKKLVLNHSLFAGLEMKTIIFSAKDIQGSQGIQEYMKFLKSKNYKIGCSHSFETFRVNLHDGYHSSSPSTDILKNSLENRLCKPLFPVIDVFVWTVSDDSSYSTRGLIGFFTDLFLTREIFMQAFPGKEVLIQFSTSYDKSALAEVYNVPIVVPLDKISL